MYIHCACVHGHARIVLYRHGSPSVCPLAIFVYIRGSRIDFPLGVSDRDCALFGPIKIDICPVLVRWKNGWSFEG